MIINEFTCLLSDPKAVESKFHGNTESVLFTDTLLVPEIGPDTWKRLNK